MPAYGFKEQFCPFVLDGTKPHTIRAYRKYPVSPGNILSLYYGLRTNHCRLLRNEKCTDVKTIAITEFGTVVVIDNPRLPPQEIEACKIVLNSLDLLSDLYKVDAYDTHSFAGKYCTALLPDAKDRLAWKDGFRPAGSSLDNPTGAFTLMMDFWRDSHAFPFVGNIIYWEPKN